MALRSDPDRLHPSPPLSRSEAYYAREDMAFNAWVDARRERLARLTFALDAEAVRDLVRSAFISGVRFGVIEAGMDRE